MKSSRSMAMIKNEYALVMGVRSSSGNGKYNAGSKTNFQLDHGLNTLPYQWSKHVNNISIEVPRSTAIENRRNNWKSCIRTSWIKYSFLNISSIYGNKTASCWAFFTMDLFRITIYLLLFLSRKYIFVNLRMDINYCEKAEWLLCDVYDSKKPSGCVVL